MPQNGVETSEGGFVDDLMSRVGSALAGLAAAAVVAGLFFMQCVYPFIDDNSTSETFTCEDERFAEFCDDPSTLGGFAASVCGRDELLITSNYIDVRVIGGEPGERAPDEFEIILQCTGLDAKWAWQEGRSFETFEDYESTAVNNDARRFTEVYGKWGSGSIATIEEARRDLFGE